MNMNTPEGTQRHYGFAYSAGMDMGRPGGRIKLGDGHKNIPSEVRVFDAGTLELKKVEPATVYDASSPVKARAI